MGAGGWALQREAASTTPDGYCSSCHAEDGSLDALAAGGHDEVDCAACHQLQLAVEAREGVARLFGAETPSSPHQQLAHRVSCVGCHAGESASSELRVEGLAAHEAHGLRPGAPPLLDALGRPIPEIECTSCHLTEGHGFSPETVGCTAARCHSDATVTLGGMAHEELDCADCHAVSAEVPAGDSLALRPTGVECLACHQMQELRPDHAVADDPHGDDCATCHLPHRQQFAAEAATTCATAGCHTRPDTLNASHRGLAPGVLEDCVGCHTPHRAQVDPQDCTACHDASGGLLPGVTGPAPRGTPGGGALGVGLGLRPLPRAILEVLTERVARWDHAPLPDTVLPARFLHEDHTPVDCVSCHTADGSEHGELVVQTASDCRQCHHVADDAPDCVTCHEGAEPGGAGLVREVQLDLAVLAAAVHRTIAFSHATHEAEDCATCHLPSETRSAAAEDCQGCHVEHHEAALDCASCHLVAPTTSHPAEQVHLGCAGAGCHEAAPAPVVDRVRDRVLCLSCHEVQRVDHYPEKSCVACHILPPPDDGGGGA